MNNLLLARNFLISLLVTLSTSACNPFYVMRAAYEESKILLAREDIEDVIQNSDTSDEERSKLKIVLNARDFSEKLNLDPKESFTAFTRTDKDVLAWVLMAARRDAFELHTWWFPIVGHVPYKGFFDKEDAKNQASELEEAGYETSIRGTEAFSTLGWFNDPLMSTTLRQDHYAIVNTVIHEILHNSIWFKNHVAFNESLANFVGIQGAKDFFSSDGTHCDSQACSADSLKKLREQSLVAEERNYLLAETLSLLVSKLEKLYGSNKPYEDKLSERQLIFNDTTSEFRRQFPNVKAFKKLNNAEIMQLNIYYTELKNFLSLFECMDSSWASFIAKLKQLQSQCDTLGDSCDPFTLLKQELEQNACLT